MKNCVSREFINDENKLRIKSVMTGTAVIIFQKISFQRNPLNQSKKKNKQIASRENFITKKMSTGSSLYYDGFGSYDSPKNCHEKTPLR